MNPYASFLDGRAPLDIIRETPDVLGRLFDRLGPERTNRPSAPGKWSAREILAHLADCEISFGFRIRQALAAPNHIIQPFDQDLWAKHYGAYDAKDALTTFTALRKWNVGLVKALPRESYSIPLTHPERGQMTFQTLIETMAGHDRNHIAQLQAILR